MFLRSSRRWDISFWYCGKAFPLFMVTDWFPRFHLFPGTMMYSGNISMIFSAPYVVLMFMPRYGSWHLFIWISILSDLFHKMFGRNARMYQPLVHFLFVISCSSISFITYLAKDIWQYAEWNAYDSNDKDPYHRWPPSFVPVTGTFS